MKTLILLAVIAIATGDVSHILKPKTGGYSYPKPSKPFLLPSALPATVQTYIPPPQKLITPTPIAPIASVTPILSVQPTISSKPQYLPPAKELVQPIEDIPTIQPLPVQPVIVPRPQPTIAPVIIPSVQPTISSLSLIPEPINIQPQYLPPTELLEQSIQNLPTIQPLSIESVVVNSVQPTISPVIIPSIQPTISSSSLIPELINIQPQHFSPTELVEQSIQNFPTVQPLAVESVVVNIQPTISSLSLIQEPNIVLPQPTIAPVLLPNVQPTISSLSLIEPNIVQPQYLPPAGIFAQSIQNVPTIQPLPAEPVIIPRPQPTIASVLLPNAQPTISSLSLIEPNIVQPQYLPPAGIVGQSIQNVPTVQPPPAEPVIIPRPQPTIASVLLPNVQPTTSSLSLIEPNIVQPQYLPPAGLVAQSIQNAPTVQPLPAKPVVISTLQPTISPVIISKPVIPEPVVPVKDYLPPAQAIQTHQGYVYNKNPQPPFTS